MLFTDQEKEYYMRLAIVEAKKAEAIGEVPIGAVIVYENQVIGTGYNRREVTQDATTHGEMLAIQAACKNQGSWRLENTALFVTLEPCPMCAGASLLARIPYIYYGAKDPKAGAVDSLVHLLGDSRFNHQATVESGILETECGLLLTNFFKQIRQKKQQEKLRRKKELLQTD